MLPIITTWFTYKLRKLVIKGDLLNPSESNLNLLKGHNISNIIITTEITSTLGSRVLTFNPKSTQDLWYGCSMQWNKHFNKLVMKSNKQETQDLRGLPDVGYVLGGG